MKTKSIFFAGTILLCCATGAFADVVPSNQWHTAAPPVEHVLWSREPIAFVVPVGKERMITFPAPVLFKGNDAAALTRSRVLVLNNNGTLYIRAKKAFKPVRVPVTLISTGETVLIDISAQAEADDTPVTVLLSNPQKQATGKAVADTTGPLPYAELMRHTVKYFYAPMRLVRHNARIFRTPMYTTRSVPLVTGGQAIAMPLASWRNGRLFITAVLIKNNWPLPVDLHYQMLRGRWLAASFYPFQTLGASGTLNDRTTVFLISDAPFNSALYNNQENR